MSNLDLHEMVNGLNLYNVLDFFLWKPENLFLPKDLWNKAYRLYLKTDHWGKIRAGALLRASFKCQACSERERMLTVHHNNYKSLGREKGSDVIVLCDDCHTVWTENNKKKKLNKMLHSTSEAVAPMDLLCSQKDSLSKQSSAPTLEITMKKLPSGILLPYAKATNTKRDVVCFRRDRMSREIYISTVNINGRKYFYFCEIGEVIDAYMGWECDLILNHLRKGKLSAANIILFDDLECNTQIAKECRYSTRDIGPTKLGTSSEIIKLLDAAKVRRDNKNLADRVRNWVVNNG